MGYFFHFSSLYSATHIELYMCQPILISYLNFEAVLVPPKMARSAQTHKTISFALIVWSTLYVYIWLLYQIQCNLGLMTFGRSKKCHWIIYMVSLNKQSMTMHIGYQCTKKFTSANPLKRRFWINFKFGAFIKWSAISI